MIGIGIGIPLTRTTSGPTLGTTIATTHYNRVIADGGVLPAGISGLGSILDSVISAYSITGSSDFNTKVPVFLDPHYTGYKLGAGSGTTLGQAAQKVYSMKDTENLVTYSNDFTNSNWSKSGAGFTVVGGYSDPNGGNNAYRFTMPLSTSNQFYQNIPNYGSLTASIYIRLVSGSGNFKFGFYDGTINQNDITLTSSWQLFTASKTVANNGGDIRGCWLYSNDLNQVIEVYHAQLNTGSVALPYTATTTTTETLADVTQTTAASQPLLLAHSGVNYWWNGGVNVNYCSTPNAAANQITGSFDIAVYASTLDWSQSYGMLQSKYTTGVNGNYYFCTMAGKKLQYAYSNGVAVPAVTTTINTPFANNTGGWLKLSHNTTTGNVSIYYSNDSVNTNPISVSWTLLESLSIAAGVRNNFNCPIEIGSNATGANTLLGKIYRATISNSIGGSPVVDFNPATYNAATSQTAWTSTTGEIWTINTGTAATGYKGVLVDRTIIQGDGIDDGLMTISNLTSLSDLSFYAAIKQQVSIPTAYGKFIDNNFTTGFSISNDISSNTLLISVKSNNSSPYGVQKSITFNRLLLSSTTRVSSTGVYTTGLNNTSFTASIDGNAGTLTADKLSLLKNTMNSQFGQNIVNTFLLSSLNDGTTTKTSLYNIIRSMNNNAF